MVGTTDEVAEKLLTLLQWSKDEMSDAWTARVAYGFVGQINNLWSPVGMGTAQSIIVGGIHHINWLRSRLSINNIAARGGDQHFDTGLHPGAEDYQKRVLKPCSFAFRRLHPLALKKLSRENRDALHIFENAKIEVTWQLVSSRASFQWFLLSFMVVLPW